MVDVSQIAFYSIPAVTSFINASFLKYKEVDLLSIAVSTVILLIAYVVYYFFNCSKPSPDVEAEVSKLKQENAGLKSNLMKIHREIIPGANKAPVRQPQKVSFEQQKMTPKPSPKIEEISEKNASGVFSESEDAKPFEQ